MRFVHDDHVYVHDEDRTLPPTLQVVLTRFNMALPGFRERGEVAGDADFADYVAKRIPIFRSICLPSLRGQTIRPDHWLIGFDGERRAETEKLIEEMRLDDWTVPVWQKTKDGVAEGARQTFVTALKALVRPEHAYVLSSRVDNDDALGRGFCEAARRYAAAVVTKDPTAEDFWISFPIGAQFNGERCFLFTQNNNAFLTRCESAFRYTGRGGGSAMQGNHSHVFEGGKVYLPITRKPIWLQSVHSSNVLNEKKKNLTGLRDTRAVLRSFSVRVDEVAGVKIALD